MERAFDSRKERKVHVKYIKVSVFDGIMQVGCEWALGMRYPFVLCPMLTTSKPSPVPEKHCF